MPNKATIEQIDSAIGAHGMWKMRLRSAIAKGSGDVSSTIAACDDRCEFGKWLYSSALDEATKAGVPYQVTRRLHADFHHAAGQVLACIERRDGHGARDVMQGEFAERSEKLVLALTKWKRELQ